LGTLATVTYSFDIISMRNINSVRHLVFDKIQVNQIKELAKQNQISRSALVRMIIREYLSRQGEDKGK
jgi:hypothetical protein